jgi:hypothetical protein
MRTTVDLPDPLLRRAKAAAALEGKSLKTFLAEAIEQRLSGRAVETTGQRVVLPLVRSARPGARLVTAEDVARALANEDHDALAGR